MGIFLLNIILIFVLLFLLGYAILWSGLRIFKIASVTRGKMIRYVLISAIATMTLQYLYAVLYLPYAKDLMESIGSGATMFLQNLPILAISFVITYPLLRYLLRLSGRQFWKLLVYIILMGFIASAILSTIAHVLRG